MDMRVTVTLLRRHKHGRGVSKVERAEARKRKDTDEGNLVSKLTKRKWCVESGCSEAITSSVGTNHEVTRMFQSCFLVFVLKCIAIFRPCKDEMDMMLVFHHRA